MTRLELLAPARDVETARIAIDCGADAIYIGAGKFGARVAAANPIDQIRALTEYAHTFGARVYLTLNTILYENELDEARRLIIQAWEAGVDALIVQDMALLEMQDLPPIELHASTQTFLIDPQRAHFLAENGCARVILERAVSLEEIRRIRAATDAEIEVFVHGAICVGFSGQCYLSHTLMGKSGNRGECAQPCRWTYNLLDDNFKRIVSDKHLLSVRDLNLSEHLEELADAGVTSFKIEGRLKDHNYIRNIITLYRSKLDALMARRTDLQRSSVGRSMSEFEPDAQKTFSRGFTEFNFDGTVSVMGSPDTPKSVGERMGEIVKTDRNSFTIDLSQRFHAADGICFTAADGTFVGTNINRVEGNRVFPNRMEGLRVGTLIYRNFDKQFTDQLETVRVRRAIEVTVMLDQHEGVWLITATDETGIQAQIVADHTDQTAQNRDRMVALIGAQLQKSGDTVFDVREVRCAAEGELPYWRAAELNEMRRRLLEKLRLERLGAYQRRERRFPTQKYDCYADTLDFRANVVNSLSEQFYRSRGVVNLETGYELSDDHLGKCVMTSRFCIRRENGMCLKNKSTKYRGKLFIENNFHTFELEFDCAHCCMSLIYRGSRK